MNKNQTLGDRIKIAIKASPYNYKEIADLLHVSPSAVTLWIQTSKISKEKLPKLAKITGCSIEWLMTGVGNAERRWSVTEPGALGDGLKYIGVKNQGNSEPVPILSWEDLEQLDTIIRSLEKWKGKQMELRPDNTSPAIFILEVKDDSMRAQQGRSYHEGMFVYVDPDQRENVVPGDRVIVRIKDQKSAVFKELAQDGDRLVLKSLNPHWPPIFEEFEVIGKVILGVQKE